MKRKEFINLSGKSIVGLSVLGQLPFYSCTTKKANIGGVMLEVKTKRLFLQHTWTISRNSSDYKDNVFVKIEKDGVTGIGEAAPNVRYGEDSEKTTARIDSVKNLIEEYDLWQFSELKDEIFIQAEIISRSNEEIESLEVEKRNAQSIVNYNNVVTDGVRALLMKK